MALLDIVTVGDANDEVLFKAAGRVREFGAPLYGLMFGQSTETAIFIGAALTATSVGIREALTTCMAFESIAI